MNSKDNHIILLNFDFPPNYGIGGRRWAKFAKELASRNIHVHVVKAEAKDKRSSHWARDVESDFIHVQEFQRRAELDRFKTDIDLLDKVGYRLALTMNKWKEAGTPYDMAIGGKNDIQRRLKEICDAYPVEWIIATGAPFNLLYFAADFVRSHSNVKLWADLRDPWLDAENYGMPQLSPNRKRAEWSKAELVLEQASVVSCPTLEAMRIFESIENGKYAGKLYELRHFFDPKDFDIKYAKGTSDAVRLVYGGDIYPGAEQYVRQMINDLKKLKEEDVELYSRMDIRFYSDNIHKLRDEFSSLDVVQLQPSIGDQIFDEIANSDWCIILLADFNKHFFTTKYFEYQPFGKPYMYLGPEGNVIKEIKEQKAGLSWSDFLHRIKTWGWSSMKQVEPGANLRSGSLQARTDELLDKMKEFQ